MALPDNQHALSGSYDKTVKLFNVNDFVGGSLDRTACIVEHGLAPQ